MMTFEWVLLRDLKLYPGVATIGGIHIDGAVECVTLEDPVREQWDGDAHKWIWKPEFKQPKATAIPSGRYKLIIDKSERFQRPMPHILNVPDFDGIRIHNGGTVEDTDGCVLTGRDLHQYSGGLPYLTGSKVDAFPRFFAKLGAALELGNVFLTVSNGV